jgi:hypothetical protein
MNTTIIGVTVRLFSPAMDDLGTVTAPLPVEPDDIVAFAQGAPIRVVCVTPFVPGGQVAHLAEVEEAHLVVTG